jgi:hypothetical protein
MSYLNLNRPTDLIAHLKMLAFIIALSAPWDVNAADEMTMLDTFEHQSDNSLGIPRQFFDDKMAGGKTHVNQTIAEGVFYAKGEIVPPRGQPGWASTVLLFNEKGLAKDLSEYGGIHLRIKVNTGNVSVSAEQGNHQQHQSGRFWYAANQI